MVTACCKKAGKPIPGKVETTGRFGLVSGHAYTFLDAKTLNGVQLVKVRNPWDSEMYTGPWSDSDTVNMTPANMKALNHTKKNDGTFWLPYEIYKANFNGLAVASDSNWNVKKHHLKGKL